MADTSSPTHLAGH